MTARRTYDLWSGYWPKVTGDPFAESLNAATKYVATHRPDGLGWVPVGKLGTDVLGGIRGLKARDGADLLVWGSTVLTASLFDQGLVDEVTLVAYPVLAVRGAVLPGRRRPAGAHARRIEGHARGRSHRFFSLRRATTGLAAGLSGRPDLAPEAEVRRSPLIATRLPKS